MPQLLLYHFNQPLLSPPPQSLHSNNNNNNFCKSCLSLEQKSTVQMIGTKLYTPSLLPLPRIQKSVATKCMANPRRVKMVAKQIQRELSDMLLTDKVLQYAVLPEASLGADRYLSSLTTISDVEVSADLQVVKVYISVFGDERGKEVAISGLKSKAKYVRSELGRRMKLRLTPEIRFLEDDSLERGSRVLAILDRLKNEKPAQMQDEDQGGDSDWEGEDPDADIIYVK